MSEQYENNKCLVHLIFWSHPWSLHPLTYKHSYITFNDHRTFAKQNIQLVGYKFQQLQLKSICFLWMSTVLGLIFYLVRQGRRLLVIMFWSCLALTPSHCSALLTRRHGAGDTGQEQQHWTTGHIHHTLTIRGQLEAGAGARPRGARPASSLVTTPPPLHWSHEHCPRRIGRDEVRSLT